MKRKHILWAAFASLLCVACVEDEGSNHMVPINELEVEGIEENYTKVGYQEKLEIEVTLKGSLSGADEMHSIFSGSCVTEVLMNRLTVIKSLLQQRTWCFR